MNQTYWVMAEAPLKAYLNNRCWSATKEELAEAQHLFGGSSNNYEDDNEILSIEDETAVISIKGHLSYNGLTPIERFFGLEGTGYNQILAALDAVESTQQVQKIVLSMFTPGGGIDGTDQVYQRIFSMRENYEIIAINEGQTLSGGYYIASAAHKIIAVAPTATTGSVGVRASWYDETKYLDRVGIKKIHILSANAPAKIFSSKAGLASLQTELNALERIFYQRISQGRGIADIKYLKDNFGHGGIMVASDPDENTPDALTVGMIDEVVSEFGRQNDTASMGANYNSIDAVSAEPSAVSSPNYLVGTPAFEDFDIVDVAWDAAAAIKRVRTKTGSEKEPSDSYKQAFFWHDSEDAENFGAYKLPFVDVVDGRLVAIKKGVQAANGAMAGARTGKPPNIPVADRKAVQAHINKYLDKIKKMQEEKEDTESMGEKTLIELMAENPKIKGEVDALCQTACQKATEELQARVEKVKPFISSAAAGSYPAVVRELAMDVLSGTKSMDTLDVVVAFFDCQAAGGDLESAVQQTKSIGDTPPVNQPARKPAENGEINTEQDLQAAARRLKGGNGVPAPATLTGGV